MAFLIGGSVWLGVTEEFLNTNGGEGALHACRLITSCAAACTTLPPFAGYFTSGSGPAKHDDVAYYISTFLFNTFVFAQVRTGAGDVSIRCSRR